MANLPANMPIPITQDSQLVITNVPNYNPRKSNTQFQVTGIGVNSSVIMYAYNTTNRGNNVLVASNVLVGSTTTTPPVLSTKKTPVMIIAAVQITNPSVGNYIIGLDTADTPDGSAATVGISFLNSISQQSTPIQPYPSNQTANLFLDYNSSLALQNQNYYQDIKTVNPTASVIQITSYNVQRDLRIHIIGLEIGQPQPQLLGVIYLDDTSGNTINANVYIQAGAYACIWILPLIAYDPPTNVASFDIGDPKNDAVVTILEA